MHGVNIQKSVWIGKMEISVWLNHQGVMYDCASIVGPIWDFWSWHAIYTYIDFSYEGLHKQMLIRYKLVGFTQAHPVGNYFRT